MSWKIRPITPDDCPRMAEITNAQVREPITVEQLAREHSHRPKEDPLLYLGATDAAGTLAGFASAVSGAGHRPGEFALKLRVDRAFQGQGAGRALYEQLLAFTRSYGATRLESSVREDEPEALAWAERRGFAKEYHLFNSYIDLAEYDPTPFREAVERARASGIRFTTLANEVRGGDRVAAIRRYYDFSYALVKDIPGNADRPLYPWEPYLQWVLNNPQWKDDLLLLAMDGDRWVALCQLAYTNSGGLNNHFTAVDPAYRGRGLALALKAHSLELAKSLGVPKISTTNHSVNRPMLAVNRRLGYRPLPGHFYLAAKP